MPPGSEAFEFKDNKGVTWVHPGYKGSSATQTHDDGSATIFQKFEASNFINQLKVGQNLLAIHGMNISPSSTDFLQVAELQTNENDYQTAIWKLIDEEAFYKFWALEGLLSFWDGYSGNRNNFFVYVNPATDKLH